MDNNGPRIEKNFQNMFGQAEKNSGQECRNAPRKHQQQEDGERRGWKEGGEREREREREKSDYFRKFMKVRLHNSFPYCDALCSRDGLTWNLRPLLLFTKEQHHGLVIPVRFLRICLIYYVSRKYKIDDEWIKFYIYIFHFQYPLFHYPPSHCT